MSLAEPFDAAFLYRLARLRLHSARLFDGRIPGERRSPRYGASLEFVDVRPYVPGDDTRYVDWNVYRRLDRIVVKRFREHRDLCLHLLVDTSASMGAGTPSKLDHGLRAGAVLACVALANHERVSVGLLADDARRTLTPRRGHRRMAHLLDLLGAIRASGRTRLGDALAGHARSSLPPGVAVIISDLIEPATRVEPGLRALLARGLDLRVVHVLADDEMSPDIDGDVELLDVEEPLPATAKRLTAERATHRRYQQNLARFLDEREALCRRLQIPYLRLAGTGTSDVQLLQQLRAAGFLA